MRTLLFILLAFSSLLSFSQDKELEAQELATKKKANNFVHQGNELVSNDNYADAEMEYRKAISEQPKNVAGAYNLGNSYYKKGNFDEALFRQQEAAKNATDKAEKHKAFHNIGNILMQNKQCKEAVEAYKNALRNDPTDEETRYNLGIAKECAAQQQKDEDKNKDKDKKDENKDEKDKKDQENKDQDNKGDQDKKDGDDRKDKGQPKDDKQDKNKGDDKQEQQQPQPGQLSPQQIKNLLEAMNNQEQKTQEKINAEKQKGAKIRTGKDW
ncbi:MAG: tetratricopeptide repeat protein [Gelidibacter sp.]